MNTLLLIVFFALLATAFAPLPGKGYKPRIVAWLWTALAFVVSRRPIANWLIRRSMRTPYSHLPGYMNRYWLFNPYPPYSDGRNRRWSDYLPSVRVHHILRRDQDRHKHDHPWDARTIILKGYYVEDKVTSYGPRHETVMRSTRLPGATAPILFGEYHSVAEVSEGGVWTLFITFGYRGTWGFLVDGVKVPWRTYMAMHPEKPWATEEVQP